MFVFVCLCCNEENADRYLFSCVCVVMKRMLTDSRFRVFVLQWRECWQMFVNWKIMPCKCSILVTLCLDGQRSSAISTCAGNRKCASLRLFDSPQLLLLLMSAEPSVTLPWVKSTGCTFYRPVSAQFSWCEFYMIGLNIARQGKSVNR
jgi:hypothetical protein